MVARPEAWVWSSYRATAGLEPVPRWLEVSWLLGQFGATRAVAREAYRRFVDAGAAATSPLDGVRGQIWLGGEAFRAVMQEALGDEPPAEIPQTQARPARPTRDELLAAVCEELGVSEGDLRSRAHQEGYRLAAYLLRRHGNLRLREVARLFGVSNARVSHIQTAMETRPPDGRLRRILERCKVKI
jgi:hypothetical protein